MKNLLFLLGTLFFFTFNADGQSRFGITAEGGIITSKKESVFVGNVSDFAANEITYLKASPSYSFGVTYQNKIGWLYMQPSLRYSQYSADYRVTSFNNVSNSEVESTDVFRNIDFHAIAGLTNENFRLGFGPIFHFLVDHKTTLDQVPTYRDNTRTLSASFSGSVGYDLYPFSFDLTYIGPFNSLGDHIFISGVKSGLSNGADRLTFAVTYTMPYDRY